MYFFCSESAFWMGRYFFFCFFFLKSAMHPVVFSIELKVVISQYYLKKFNNVTSVVDC